MDSWLTLSGIERELLLTIARLTTQQEGWTVTGQEIIRELESLQESVPEDAHIYRSLRGLSHKSLVEITDGEDRRCNYYRLTADGSRIVTLRLARLRDWMDGGWVEDLIDKEGVPT